MRFANRSPFPVEVTGVPEFTSFETDLAAARKLAVERRPELQQGRLAIEQATLDRRIKKSEYIPDVSAGFVYLTPRNYAPVIPKNFANVGVVVSWEFFDWGRKKHQLAEKDKLHGTLPVHPLTDHALRFTRAHLRTIQPR